MSYKGEKSKKNDSAEPKGGSAKTTPKTSKGKNTSTKRSRKAQKPACPMQRGSDVTLVSGTPDSGTNHPSWYTVTGSIERLVGANFFKKKAAQSGPFANSSDAWINGLNMSIWLALTIPMDKTNAFHTDIVQLYKNIRRSNSGAANYTVSDLERYVLNVRSIRACLASLVRARRAFNAIDPLSQTVPFDLVNTVTGTSADTSTWMETLANVDAQLSKMGALIETALPCGDLTIFDRTDWLFGNVFRDSDGPKYSYIACLARSFPVYEVTDTGIALASSQPLSSVGRPGVNLQAACTTLWQYFAAFNGEYKNALIAGDIMHAFGEKAFKRTLHWQEVNAPLVPIYNLSVLYQIQNATIACRNTAVLNTSSIANGVTTQTCSYTTSVTTTKSMAFDYAGTYINGKFTTLAGGDLLTITRLCWSGTNQNDAIQILSCGSEIPVDITFNYCAADGITGRALALSTVLGSTQSSVQSTATLALMRIASYWSQIDWAPMILLYSGSEVLPVWDVDNLAFIDWVTMDDYHSAATTSLFWSSMTQ